MEQLGPLVGLFFLALLVEGFVEYFVATPVKEAGWPTWWLRYIALMVGVAAAILYRADLPGLVGLDPITPEVSWVATGIIVARGANYLSDLLGRLADLMGGFRE